MQKLIEVDCVWGYIFKLFVHNMILTSLVLINMHCRLTKKKKERKKNKKNLWA